MATVFARQGVRRFTTKAQGHNLRRNVWICDHCHGWHKETKPRDCKCGNDTFTYFPSTKEAERAAHLLMQSQYGLIDKLEFHPAFDYSENGIHVFTWRADSRYRKLPSGQIVVEDVKNSLKPGAWDPVFVLKKKLIEARYGFEIQIVTGR
jgi:hypothetical protein